MKVIINADDFGYGENKTLAITEAIAKGLVTTTTAMANMPWFDRAIQIAKEKGFINQVGLHFNLTEGRALTPEMRACRVFSDENGNLMPTYHHSLKNRLYLPRAIQDIIAIEAEAQIRKYVDAGCTLMHLDSHHHVHTDFSVAQPLLNVARRYGFRSVRLSRTIGDHIAVDKRLYKMLFNPYLTSRIPARTDEFTEYEGFVKYRDQINSEARVEIMMHPQYAEDRLLDTERDMSGDESFWQQLEAKGVKRVNYATI